MAFQDALTLLAQLLQLPDAATAKASIIAMMQGADPPIDATAFILGEPTERWIDASAQMIAAWGIVPTMATRAMFLRLATDPGDIADDGTPDQSADQTPRPGMLSVAGASWFGTIREEQLFATGFVTVTNVSGSTITFKPFDLTVERNFAAPSDGGHPTYRNSPDPTIYTNLDGSTTLANLASKTIPIQADQIGTYASASSGTITTLVTQSFGVLNVSNAVAVNGRDREERSAYLARCFLAPSANAPGGPAKAYLRAMNTNADGSVLQRFDSSGPVNITAAQVLRSNGQSTVTGYLAGPSGAIDAIDLSSANANITGIALGVIIEPIGVLPDGVTILPTATDPNTGGPGFASAINTTIAVTYSAKIAASKVPGGAAPGTYTTGGSPPTPVANVFSAIGLALGSYLPGLGPGGLDQTAGAGFVYTSDVGDVIREGFAGIYNVVLSLPSASTTSIAVGHIATQGTTIGTLVVVAG